MPRNGYDRTGIVKCAPRSKPASRQIRDRRGGDGTPRASTPIDQGIFKFEDCQETPRANEVPMAYYLMPTEHEPVQGHQPGPTQEPLQTIEYDNSDSKTIASGNLSHAYPNGHNRYTNWSNTAADFEPSGSVYPDPEICSPFHKLNTTTNAWGAYQLSSTQTSTRRYSEEFHRSNAKQFPPNPKSS